MVNFSLSSKRQAGVTLLEMMITLAVAAILLTVVAPNIQSILTSNRITAEINETSALLQFARYTAIDEQSQVVVCPSSNFATCNNDWNNPKIVFLDLNGNGSRDGAEELLQSSQAISGGNKMTSSQNLVEFNESGGTTAAADIVLCPKNNDAKFARGLIVSLQGRTRLSRDESDDGFHEDSSGTSLACS
ncbi:GspH/FimT family pseudopilin [Ningiella sp. W23]|uniref:GspH/FimT family pseudopilin n=1 Tax=Ningiella sp. W23 TaxID=3023715 RepID=UPI003758265E